MKFYDKVQIICTSGNGWNGATSARREAGVPYGWPNGGNGGHGGSVIFQADSNYNTLIHLRFQKERAAKEWGPGESTDKYGKSAEDLIIPVPVGSVIKVIDNSIVFADTEDEEDGRVAIRRNENGEVFDDDEEDMDDDHNPNSSWSIAIGRDEPKVVYHLTNHGDTYTICYGGQGGAGNMHFKNSHVQYPDFSLLGEPGQEKIVEIELQLLADVGLIGMPSVGKSSIINSVCNTKAKVAEYHFTTLIPNLGSVKYNDEGRNIIDIPGLVEWASDGKWLGNEFLRHVLKARLFAFVLDITRWDEGITEFGKLRKEILHYISTRFVWSSEFGFDIESISYVLDTENNQIILRIYDQEERLVLEKWIMRIVNKIDEVMDEEILTEYKNQLMKHIIASFAWSDLENKINKKSLELLISHNIFEYSTILDQLKKPLLQIMMEKLKNIIPFNIHFDPVEARKMERKKRVEEIGSLDDESTQKVLSDLWFQLQDFATIFGENEEIDREDEEEEELDEYGEVVMKDDVVEVSEDERVKKLFKLYDPEVTRLWFQLPWWKVLAEERFRRVIKQQWVHKWLWKAWVKNGDILWIVWDYNSKKHVVCTYALGTTKTSYKHQKLT